MKNVIINQNEIENYGYTNEYEKYNEAVLAYENGNTLLVKNIIKNGMLSLLRFMNYVEYFVNTQSNSYSDLASTHNIQDLVEEVENENKTNFNNIPEWLTTEVISKAKTTWHEHKDVNDHKRIEAMRIVQNCAKNAGYDIGIKKATEILTTFCI